MVAKLVLLRHGESIWNQENLFTGWTDVDLSENGKREANAAGYIMKEADFCFDICYTSYLKRAIHTLNIVLEEMDAEWLPIYKNWRLNERHYGALQGLNKSETARKYGEDQVKIWRRSFDIKPPELKPGDRRAPNLLRAYQKIPPDQLPLSESLKDTIARVIPYFEEEIKPQLMAGNRILVTAHGNSLRALIMYLEHLSEDEIVNLNLPTGIPLAYCLDSKCRVTEKEFLGDPAAIKAKIQEVTNQGKADGRNK